ncbi:helix-turn-helix domain-containing protein [Paenibacillus sp. UNC451MF]|uniref:helix-turn-helix domain-containing protein n=1 Tax=Paenibacillus sp. UNC451MF TaxID=1449063 RepID=UPI00048D6860|nr:AraC family transcriptional regulator [Paenibacillus sp. UNC451MF]
MSMMVQDAIGFTLFDVKKVQYQSRVIFDYIQSCYTISYIKQGKVTITCEGKEYEARTGDVMLHRPHIPFNVISKTDGIHYLFNIELNVKGREDFFHLYPLDRVVQVRDSKAYENKFDELNSIWLQEVGEIRTMQSGFLAFFLLHEIIESSKGGVRQCGREPFETDRFNRALQYMEQRLETGVSREELASLYHMNPVYFSRAFKNIYGITPMKMLHKLRLLHAKRMLENPENTIEMIAQQSGFYDASHFNRMFRKAFNISPNNYRKSIKSTKSRIFSTLSSEEA